MCQQQPDRGLLGVVPFFAPPQMSFFNCAGAPRLMVRSLGRAIEFYDRVLGFDPIEDGGSEVRVRRARATLSLCQGERDALTARDGHSPWVRSIVGEGESRHFSTLLDPSVVGRRGF